MTEKETRFQELLALISLAANKEWIIRKPSGYIRTPKGACPLCAMVNEVLGSNYTNDAWGSTISLMMGRWKESYDHYYRSIIRVVEAADNYGTKEDRIALLQALGLSEK